MNAALISTMDFGTRQLYILTNERFIKNCYVWVIIRPPLGSIKTQHMTAYMNVDRELWNQVPEETARIKWGISFEGVPSPEMLIPVDLTRHIPVLSLNYWVGVDWMDANPQPANADILMKMHDIFDSYLEAIHA